ISEQEQSELLKSGTPRFANQVAWARNYLKLEGYIDSSKKGVWVLTEAGANAYLSEEDARRIFLKWVAYFQGLRQKKSNASFVTFKVLFQCKRFDKTVSPSHIREFQGAIGGRADKGIIITTGTFSSEAKKEAVRDGASPIELVNGQKLVEMFENLELGLKPR